jgi:hypothetical protein
MCIINLSFFLSFFLLTKIMADQPAGGGSAARYLTNIYTMINHHNLTNHVATM